MRCKEAVEYLSYDYWVGVPAQRGSAVRLSVPIFCQSAEAPEAGQRISTAILHAENVTCHPE